MTEPAAPPAVLAGLALAAQQITAVGKSMKNEQAGYSARSIDDILDAVHGPLADAGLVLVPSVRARTLEQRTSSNGRALNWVTLEVLYTFHSAADGSQLAVGPFWGEAMDSGDKATNKALSAALKQMLIQTFTIPVAGDDADRHDPQVAAETMADPIVLDALQARLSAIQERLGRNAYPRAWQAELPSIPAMRETGITERQAGRALAILTAAEAALPAVTEQPAEAAVVPAEAIPAAEATICPECGLSGGDHADGCPQETF